jgi:L-ascorbate metabolism protein UlaG (beta-lactamase superfamily)
MVVLNDEVIYMAKITWFGHAAFKIELENKIVLVDPWLDGNPASSTRASEITQADIVYVTHDHSDHLGDAFDICKRTNATFVAAVELAEHGRKEGIKNVAGLNIGGGTTIKEVRLTVVQATHTASKGTPTGVIIEGEGKTIYHAGDTGLLGDMRLFGELYGIDLALLPIGGYYTMGAREAAEAVKLLNPKAVIPMHYGSFPVLAKSADEFVKYAKEKSPKVKIIVLKPGGNYQL